MSNQFPDPLSRRDEQERAEDRAERRPVELADLSALECEALLLLEKDTFRMLSVFMMRDDVSDALRAHSLSVKQALLSNGLAENAPAFLSCVRLTDEGARLQAELLARRGDA